MSLIKKLMGRDLEKERKIKEEADRAQAQYEAAEGVSVPEEEGIIEGDETMLIPDMSGELAKKGWVGGMAPLPPSKSAKSAAKRLDELSYDKISKALSPERLAEAAQKARLGEPVRFLSSKGELLGEIGPGSSAYKQLAESGKAATQEATNAAPTFFKGIGNEGERAILKEKAPRISGEALELYKKTGVDPTRITALDYLKKLREKKKFEE